MDNQVSNDQTTNKSEEWKPSIMDLKLIENISGCLGALGLFLSFIFLVIHLYRFFTTNTQQTLATRNLTTYCLYLLSSYIFYIFHLCIEDDLTKQLNQYMIHYYLTDSFIHILLSSSLLVMAFDTCLCLKNTVVHFSVSTSDSNNLKFFIYRFLELFISLLLTASLLLFSNKEDYTNDLSSQNHAKIIIILGIRFMCMFLFIASIVYLRLASINKTALRDFSLYLRLLVITGVIQIAQNTIYAIRLVVSENNEYDLINSIVEVGTFWEGFTIGILFTIKKNTFRRKLSRSTRYKNLSKTLSTTLSPKLSVISNLRRDEKIRESNTPRPIRNIYSSTRKLSDIDFFKNNPQYM